MLSRLELLDLDGKVDMRQMLECMLFISGYSIVTGRAQ